MEKRNDPLIGKLFFKTYKVRKRLGEGSFGTIYTCYDIHTKEEYAVKLVGLLYYIISFIIIIYIGKKRKRSIKKSFRN